MKSLTAKKLALVFATAFVLFVGAWVSMDAVTVSIDTASISAEASGGCGGCGGVPIIFFDWHYGPSNCEMDGGCGGGGGGGGPVPPSCTLSASPTSISPGGSSVLSWTTLRGTSAYLDNGIGSVALNGSTTVYPTGPTNYTLTVTGAGGTVTCEQNIIINTPPTPVCSLDLSKSQISWSTQNATNVVITAVTAGSPAIPSPQGLSGLYNFNPNLGVGTHTYNLTATGPGGTVLCGVTVTITPQPSPTCTLTASAHTIPSGGSATLSWTTTNVTSVSINNGIGGVAATGSTSVSPSSSTTYVLTATGPGGVVTCQEAITVTPPPLPVCFLTLSPTAISWNTTNATSITLAPTTLSPTIPSPGLNGSYTFSSPLGVGTHSYTLTATGPGGSVICQGTIHIDPPPSAPSCTLDANPTSILQGGTSVLSWTTNNATSFSINQGIGALATANGSMTVSPTVTKTYTLTATGSGGVVTCQKTITVTIPSPTPACTLNASPSSITAGGSSTLTWTTTNATSVSIDNGVGAVALDGSTTVSPTVSKTYTLTAHGAGGTVTCQKTITVTPPLMPLCSADLSKNQLSWTTQNATSVVITAVTLGSPAIPSPQALSGSYNFVPALGVGTHTYSLTATGPGGTVLCGVTVTITPQPSPTCTLDAHPTTITAGGSSTLTWTTTNATSVTINQGVGSVSVNGSTSVSPATSKTYTLTATGAGGVVTCQQTITVTPNPVPVCSLNLSPTAISWTTTNATALTLAPTTASPLIPAPALNGSYTFPSPLAVGTHTYHLNATGPGGSVTCDATITVDPVIPNTPSCTLSATPSSVAPGSASALSWTTANAVSATVDQGVGAVTPIAAGATAVSVPSTRTYTMTVTNSAGVTRTCQTTITTNTPGPACTISVSSSNIRTGQSITVSWTSSNATAGTITNIGAATPVSSGSTDVFPPSDTTYTGTFTGPAGTVSCSASVTVTPGTTGCQGNCGGGLNPPNVVLYKQPTNQPLAFVSLSQIPYTGFSAGILLTILFWLSIGILCALVAYFIAGKGGIRFILGRLGILHMQRAGVHDETTKFVVHEREREKMYGAPYPTPIENYPAEENYVASTVAVTHAPSIQSPVSAVASAPSVKAVDGIPHLHDVIESRAHAGGVLMSPEAVSVAVAISPDRTETLRVFGAVLNEAIKTIPRENGWIMLNADRLTDLLRTRVDAPVAPIELEVAPAVASQGARMTKTENIVSETQGIDESVAADFAKAIIGGDRDSAFSIVRALEHDKVSPTALMTATATVLDKLFRARKDNREIPNASLVAATANLSDESLAHLVSIFTHALDTVYASPFTGVKLALAQAFETVA